MLYDRWWAKRNWGRRVNRTRKTLVGYKVIMGAKTNKGANGSPAMGMFY
jgi:hypothetical protein